MDHMQSFLTGFDALDALSQLRLAQALADPWPYNGNSFGDVLPFLFLYEQSMIWIDTTCFSFLDAMSQAFLRYWSNVTLR
jgi:hypothetical protein